jgi:hypothetical protein
MAINKSITSRTSGSGDSTSQVFLSNTISTLSDAVTSPFYFNVPVVSLEGGGATFMYYKQTTNGISASLNNIKTFTFSISANTESLSGTTKMKHDIYRIDYNTYTAFTSTDISLTSTTVSLNVLASGTTTALGINPNASTAITEASLSLFSSINTPFYTTFEDVSGATFMIGSAHTLTLPQKVKPNGLYTQDLFVDKAQYFIDSTFLFETPVSQTLGDVQMYSGNQIVQLYDMPYSSTTFVQTSNNTSTITGGTFAGTNISGATFTYFVPPKKPNINVVDNTPSVIGTLDTFAPIFSFNNTEDGDKYAIQINYNTGDTTFTGTTTIFNAQYQPGNAEYIRTVALVVTPNSEFIYRIGNVKEIINLFSVKQNITTWSEFVYAQSSNDGNFELSGHTYLNLIGGTPIIGCILTLTVLSTNSSVDLGSDTIIDPSITSSITSPLGGSIGSTKITTSIAPDGSYTFGRINGGNYTVTCQNPDPFDFPTQTVNIFISSDTTLDFIFSLLWGNTVIDFSDNPPGPFMFL